MSSPAKERGSDKEREPDTEVVDDTLVVERHVYAPELADRDAGERERHHGEECRVVAQPPRREHDNGRNEGDDEEPHAVVVLDRGPVEPVRTEKPPAHRPAERTHL